MACEPEFLRKIPLLALLDDDELKVLSHQVELRSFVPLERIFCLNDPAGPAYLVAAGRVQVTTVDEDYQDVIVSESGPGSFLGLSSMLNGVPQQTEAVAQVDSVCIELTREDLSALVRQKPEAGLDILTVLAGELQEAQHLVRKRIARHPNVIIEESTTRGDRLADAVARFGGSWAFISTSAILLCIYVSINLFLCQRAWDPYPFILLNLFLSMLAAFQAPIIMMSQNRQDIKDRLRSELDFEVNRRSEAEIRDLSGKLIHLRDAIRGMEERAGVFKEPPVLLKTSFLSGDLGSNSTESDVFPD